MRRFLSLSLLLLLWLTPLAALMPAGQDSSVPMCCRRHGAHHCAMSADTPAIASDGSHRVSAPSHCPLYHQSSPATIPVFLMREPAAWQASGERHLRSVPAIQSFLSGTSLAHSGRAPPAAC